MRVQKIPYCKRIVGVIVKSGLVLGAATIAVAPATAQSDTSSELKNDDGDAVQSAPAPSNVPITPPLHEPAFLAPGTMPSSRVASRAGVTEGRIIYSRTVAYGSAIGPRIPGPAQTVVTGPTGLILDSLGAGLETLGDDENAGIVGTSGSAALGTAGNTTASLAIVAGTIRAASDIATGTQTTAITNLSGATVNGAVGLATGALSSAMGALRNATGGGT